MKQLIGYILLIVFLLLLGSGAIGNAIEFFTWLFVLDYSQPELSVAGEIIVRILTFLVSFSLVGLIFDFFGLYNKAAMKLVYLIISSLAGFVLAYVVWTIEQYLLTIGIVLGIVLLLTIAGIVVFKVSRKRKEKQTKNGDQD